MSNEPQKSEPNNLEWLSKLTDECFYEENYAGARVHFELAITAKINEIVDTIIGEDEDYGDARLEIHKVPDGVKELHVPRVDFMTRNFLRAELRKRKDEVL